MKAVGMLFLTVSIGGLWACSSGPPVGSIEQPLCNCNVEDPPCCCTSPILIDVAGDGFRLTSWTDGVEFAPRPGFRPSARAWTEPNSDDAWLVLDRDGDGVINDGSEMFGNATPQPQPAAGTLRNGFLALAQYDDDGNGTIDERDAIFSELRLWQDTDHDGASQPLELHTLLDLGVAGISLDYAEAREVDQHGNSFRYKAAVYGTPGSSVGMTAWDVWLVGAKPEPAVSFREADAGNPKELKRCYRAAKGDYYTWREYCKTVPIRIRRSCYDQAERVNEFETVVGGILCSVRAGTLAFGELAARWWLLGDGGLVAVAWWWRLGGLVGAAWWWRLDGAVLRDRCALADSPFRSPKINHKSAKESSFEGSACGACELRSNSSER